MYREWDVEWAPKSWWIALSVIGRQSPLPTRFNAVVTISNLYVRGRLRTALPNDISSCRLAFCEKPKVEFKTNFQLLWGRLPLPVRVSIESRVCTPNPADTQVHTPLPRNSSILDAHREPDEQPRKAWPLLKPTSISSRPRGRTCPNMSHRSQKVSMH